MLVNVVFSVMDSHFVFPRRFRRAGGFLFLAGALLHLRPGGSLCVLAFRRGGVLVGWCLRWFCGSGMAPVMDTALRFCAGAVPRGRVLAVGWRR